MFIELLCLAKILKSSYFKHSLNYQAVFDIKIFLIYLVQGVIHMIEMRTGESCPRKIIIEAGYSMKESSVE